MANKQSGLASLAVRPFTWVEKFKELSEAERRKWNNETSLWLLDQHRSDFFFSFPKVEQDSIFLMLSASLWASHLKGLSIEAARNYKTQSSNSEEGHKA